MPIDLQAVQDPVPTRAWITGPSFVFVVPFVLENNIPDEIPLGWTESGIRVRYLKRPALFKNGLSYSPNGPGAFNQPWSAIVEFYLTRVSMSGLSILLHLTHPLVNLGAQSGLPGIRGTMLPRGSSVGLAVTYPGIDNLVHRITFYQAWLVDAHEDGGNTTPSRYHFTFECHAAMMNNGLTLWYGEMS